MSRYELTDTISELLGVPVKERSVNAMVPCPFHEDRHPSFSIHLNEGMWYCFSCGEKGGLTRLFRLLGEEMSDSLRHDRLIRSLDREPERRRDFSPIANRQILALREKGTSSRGQVLLRGYLESRPIRRHIALAHGVGYSEEHDALSFPYLDDDRVTGIKYRRADGSKGSETGSHFGIFAIENARGKQCALVAEGESDTLAAASWLEEAPKIGVCGLSGAQHDARTWELWALDFLFAERVYLALDADEAGDSGFETAKSVLGDKAYRLRPTHGKDLSEHIAAGGTLEELGLEERYLEI